MFVTVGISWITVLIINQMPVIDVMMSKNLSDIAILNIKGSDYRCIISLICKNEAMNLFQNVDLTEHYKQNNIKYKNLLSCVKNGYRNFNVWRY